MSELSPWTRAVSRACRWFPAGTRGKWRIARFLLGRSLRQCNVVLLHEFGCALKVPSLSEPIAFSVLVDGSYESDLLTFLSSQLKQGSVFVDVGANIGALAIPAAILCGASGKVIAIEASPAMYDYLQFNASIAPIKNMLLFQCAATEREELVPFYEPPSTHFGMGSIAPQFGVLPIQVIGRRLDGILADADIHGFDVLKVDVEGYEAQVFNGARVFLESDNPPIVVFEFCDWAETRSGNGCGKSQEILLSFGYKIWTLREWNQSAAPLQEPIRSGFETLIAVKSPSMAL